jgi:hypothetical protein
MSRRFIAAFATILIGSLLSIAHTSGPKPDGQAGPVTGKPLSGIEERHSEQIMDDGTRADHPSSGLFYRDEQGRMRIESQTKVVIYDPAAGAIYIADLRTKTYRKMPIQSASPVSIVVVEDGIWISSQAPPMPAPVRSAPVSTGSLEKTDSRTTREDLPPAVMAGLKVRGSRVTSTIPPGTLGNDHDLKSVNERWYSDDIKVLVRSSSSDPRFGSLKYELTNISQTPPDPSLFQVPAGFTLIADKK